MNHQTSWGRTDGELLSEFADERDERAFSELVRRHGGMVLSVCRSVLGNTTDAEDAAQAVFLTLAQKARGASVQAHLVGWLHRVAWYVAARGAAARAVRRRHEQEAARMRQEMSSSGNEPVQLDLLHAGLAKLGEKYRVALILHHLEGRSHAETAALTGCSLEAVAVRLHRGREMLRQRLGRKGIAASSAALAGLWGASAMAEAPPLFVANATQAATAIATGKALSVAAISGQALALSQGATQMLFWAKMKVAASFMVIMAFTAGVVGTVLVARAHQSPPAMAGVSGAANAPAAAAATSRVVTGVITAVDANSITFQQRAGQPITASFNAATVVQVNEKPATTADLKVDMSVAVFFEMGSTSDIDSRLYAWNRSNPMSAPA